MGRVRCGVLVLLLLPAFAMGQQTSSAPGAAAPADIDALLHRLARPAPATTAFVKCTSRRS
jgi:hypothetical protein